MDRLDRLTQRLLEGWDRQAVSSSCVGLSLLGQFASGRLDPHTRERVDTHLNDCLACLNRFVELRDDLHGVAAPGHVSPLLTRTLNGLIRQESNWVRRALIFRVPASWAAVGMAAAILITWTITYTFQRPSTTVEWPFPVSDPTSPDRLKPARSQAARTVSGVVSSVRDATSNGVEAHVVSLKDASGATYVLFAWGRPAVRPGDAVEIDGIFTSATQSPAGLPVYQGVATQLRRAR